MEQMIKDINQDLSNMTQHELGKVYKYIRRNIIANLPVEAHRPETDKLLELTKLARKIREEKNILINIYTNASGFLWDMMKVDSGTDLGWCDHSGDCEWSGSFTTYEKALENAINLVEKCDLEEFKRVTSSNKFHWGNYADHLIRRYGNKS